MSKAIIMDCICNIIDATKVNVLHHENTILFSGDALMVSSIKILAENTGIKTSGYMERNEKENTVSVQIYL